MPRAGRSGGRDPAARAVRALERGATALGTQVARAVHERWRRSRTAPAIDVRRLPPAAPVDPPAAPPVEPPRIAPSDVSEIEVRDLRAELARELERLSGAEISAARGDGRIAGEASSGDGQG